MTRHKTIDIHTRLSALIGLLAAASVAASCERLTSGRYATWKCFTVDTTTAPAPHAEMGDRYCVVTRGEAPSLQGFLDPGAGMSNCKAIGGGSRIPLVVVDDTATVKAWEFEVDITDHPPSDHGREHKKPNSGYVLQVAIPVNATAKAQAEIKISGPEIFDGVAHSNED